MLAPTRLEAEESLDVVRRAQALALDLLVLELGVQPVRRRTACGVVPDGVDVRTAL